MVSETKYECKNEGCRSKRKLFIAGGKRPKNAYVFCISEGKLTPHKRI